MAKKGFGKHANAMRMRDAIAQVVRSQLDQHRPDNRVGTVLEFDPLEGTVTVIFPGDDDAQLVAASRLMMPSAIDNLVRVSGRPGAYYVTDIVEGDPWCVAWGGSVGDMKFWPGDYSAVPEAAQSLWVPCDGLIYDAADYPELYMKLGNLHGGAGDLFALPDLRRRFPRGADPDSGSTWDPGNTEGAALASRTINHSHTITASADHTHNITGRTSSDGSHDHGAGTLATGSTTDRAAGGLGRATTAISGNTGTTGGHDHSGSSLTNADNGAHSHGGSTATTATGDFPYSIVHYLIKVL